ncbi:MAG: hypothetical protein QME51_02455 [Planctomycetota bacterium]|nr:hypothetical protein [Planctomycetota bacterium]
MGVKSLLHKVAVRFTQHTPRTLTLQGLKGRTPHIVLPVRATATIYCMALGKLGVCATDSEI